MLLTDTQPAPLLASSLRVVLAVGLAAFLGACGEAEAEPTGKKVTSAGADDNKPAVAPEMMAKLAAVSGKFACIEKKHPEGPARTAAQERALGAVDITRDDYEENVGKVAGDAMYLANVKQASALCGAGGDPEAAAANAMRGKLKALAVASQCMAKQGKSGDEMNQVMMAQYRAYNITMSVYAREMAKLTNDRPFQDEVREAVEACPAAEPVAKADATSGDAADVGVNNGDAGGEQGADTAPSEDASEPDTTGTGEDTAGAGAGADTTNDPDEAPTAADGAADNEGGEAADTAEAGGDPAPNTGIGDELPGQTPPLVKPLPKPTGPNYSGTWTGNFKGGKLTVRVRGRKVTATVIGGSSRITAKGSIRGSRVSFSGRRAQAYAKFNGKIKGNKMSGRMMATLNMSGTLRPLRGSWSARK